MPGRLIRRTSETRIGNATRHLGDTEMAVSSVAAEFQVSFANSSRTGRRIPINLSVPICALREIDTYVQAHGGNRSGFMVSAALSVARGKVR